MTSHEPPVYMDEDDDRSCFHSHMNTAIEEASVSYLCHIFIIIYELYRLRYRMRAPGFSNDSYSSENFDFFKLMSNLWDF